MFPQITVLFLHCMSWRTFRLNVVQCYILTWVQFLWISEDNSTKWNCFGFCTCSMSYVIEHRLFWCHLSFLLFQCCSMYGWNKCIQNFDNSMGTNSLETILKLISWDDKWQYWNSELIREIGSQLWKSPW